MILQKTHHIGIILCLNLLFFTVSCNSEKGNPDKIRDVPVENTYTENTKINALTKAIEENPQEAANYVKRARVLMELKKVNLALLDIEKAVSIDSSNGNYYLEMAKIQRANNNIVQGLRAARQAELLRVTVPELYVIMGEMLLIARDYANAINYLNKAIDAAPFYAEAYFYKGIIASEQGDTTRALLELRTAIEQEPEYVDAYNKLAAIYLSQKKYDVAYQYLISGLRFEPENAMINYNIGHYYLYKNQRDSARNFFKKAVFFDQTLYIAHYNLATFSYLEKNYSQAATYFENAIKYNDNYSEAHFYLGVCYEILNKSTEAIAEYEKVLAIGNTYTETAGKALGSLRKRLELKQKAELANKAKLATDTSAK